MPYYTKDPNRDHSFDNHPFDNMMMIWVLDCCPPAQACVNCGQAALQDIGMELAGHGLCQTPKALGTALDTNPAWLCIPDPSESWRYSGSEYLAIVMMVSGSHI